MRNIIDLLNFINWFTNLTIRIYNTWNLRNILINDLNHPYFKINIKKLLNQIYFLNGLLFLN